VRDLGRNRKAILREQGSGAGLRVRWRSRALPVLAVMLCGLLATACDRGDHPARIGSRAPQFTVADEGRTVSLSELRGHVVILNFWATWCIPCIEEVPSLVALQHRMPDVKVVAISSDEDAAAYRQFLVDNHVDFLTVREASSRTPKMYGTIKIPETYVIDRNGILRRKFVSAQDWTSPEILDYLNKLQG
jgi:cytochrome c biogenesis protein CcmG/thiol:disulfide interchange protein DsbE